MEARELWVDHHRINAETYECKIFQLRHQHHGGHELAQRPAVWGVLLDMERTQRGERRKTPCVGERIDAVAQGEGGEGEGEVAEGEVLEDGGGEVGIIGDAHCAQGWHVARH